MTHIWRLWKLSNFQDPSPHFSIYVQYSPSPPSPSYLSLTLDVQFQTNPSPSLSRQIVTNNQSIKRKHNLSMTNYVIRSFLQVGFRFQYESLILSGFSFHLAEASLSAFLWLYTLVHTVKVPMPAHRFKSPDWSIL